MINFDNIEYVSSSLYATTAFTPYEPTQFKGIKKILGAVIGVVAAIAVPFLAPVIGTALGGGFFASVAGQALIGAGIGAIGGGVSSAVSGGDIIKGALFGAAGGALTGGGAALLGGASLTGGAAASTGAVDAAIASGGGTYGALDAALAGTTNTAVAGTGAGAGLATSGGTSTAAGTTAAAGGSTISTGFKNAAIQTLLNGGTQMLQSMAPDQQAQLLKQMQQEMAVTKATDEEAYQAQKKIFDDYYNYAKGLNPDFFAQLERSNEMQRQAAAWQDSERSMRGTGYGDVTVQSEKRKAQIAGSAGLNTASATGYLKGQAAQGSAFQTASNLYPKRSPSTMSNLQSMYGYAGSSAADTAGGIAGLMAPWSVYAQDRTENPGMYKSVVV